MNSNLFTNVGLECWDWPLIVDSYYGSFVQTIRVSVDPSNIPVVNSSSYVNAVDRGKEKERSLEHHGSNQGSLA